MKPRSAAFGCRVKSGWAAVVLLTGPIDSPKLRDSRVINLSDPQFPETRQPYHAAMGKLETDATEINRRVRVVRGITRQSITALLANYRQEHYMIERASLIVGSRIDPATVVNPHIRAHALEGRLFCSVLEETLGTHKIHTTILLERDAYASAAAGLKKSPDNVWRAIQQLGRSTEGPWRADQKLAALAAWLALR